MKPLVFCAFPPCWYVDVSFCFEDDEAAFGFETGKRRQEGEKILSLRVCLLTPPSDLNMDSSEPPGSTTWTDPQLRAKTVVFLQSQSLFLLTIWSFSYQNRKESDTSSLHHLLDLEFSFPAQTCQGLFWRFPGFSSEVQVWRAEVGLNAMAASVLASHRFRWTNSELYTR